MAVCGTEISKRVGRRLSESREARTRQLAGRRCCWSAPLYGCDAAVYGGGAAVYGGDAAVDGCEYGISGCVAGSVLLLMDARLPIMEAKMPFMEAVLLVMGVRRAGLLREHCTHTR
eukprot:3900109-Rhodomonas_salina.2